MVVRWEGRCPGTLHAADCFPTQEQNYALKRSPRLNTVHL